MDGNKDADSDFHGEINATDESRFHSAQFTPGSNVRVLRNMKESRWHHVRIAIDFSHRDRARSVSKVGGLVVLKLPSGAILPVSMLVCAHSNENDELTVALLRNLDAALGGQIYSAPGSDPRTWTELWGDQKVTQAIRKQEGNASTLHIFDDFKHLAEKAPKQVSKLLHGFVRRSMPETAAQTKEQMVAVIGQEAVDSLFENGRIEAVALSRRAFLGFWPNGDIYAMAETHNSVHKAIGARSTAVTTAMELMFRASFERLLRDYSELVAVQSRGGDNCGTPHWSKRQAA